MLLLCALDELVYVFSYFIYKNNKVSSFADVTGLIRFDVSHLEHK